MWADRPPAPLAFDLARLHRRTVTSFYSNLVTRPTGGAVRMGVESQIADLGAGPRPSLSILDFTQVRVLDYSCADEIVAKLLLRFADDDRPAEAYFLARGLHEHHIEAVDAVLERHGLLLAVERPGQAFALMGPSDPVVRACWGALTVRGRAAAPEIADDLGLPVEAVAAVLQRLLGRRVAVSFPDGRACTVPALARAFDD
jgi:hypothetical protein